MFSFILYFRHNAPGEVEVFEKLKDILVGLESKYEWTEYGPQRWRINNSEIDPKINSFWESIKEAMKKGKQIACMG